MGTPGSAPRHFSLPAWLSPLVVLVGAFAMVRCFPPALTALGLRPALALSELALALPGLIAVITLGVSFSEGVGLRAVDRRTALLAVAAGGGLWLTSLGLFELQYVVWKPDPVYLASFKRLLDLLRPKGPLDAVLSVLAIAVGPAVCEELLMRGIVLPSLWRPLGLAGALLVSSLLFAGIHLDLYRFPFTFLAGLGLGLLRARSGSLLPSMLAHAVLNTTTLVLAPYVDDPTPGLPDPRPMLGLGALLAGGAACALVWRLIVPPPAAGAEAPGRRA